MRNARNELVDRSDPSAPPEGMAFSGGRLIARVELRRAQRSRSRGARRGEAFIDATAAAVCNGTGLPSTNEQNGTNATGGPSGNASATPSFSGVTSFFSGPAAQFTTAPTTNNVTNVASTNDDLAQIITVALSGEGPSAPLLPQTGRTSWLLSALLI